MGDADYLTTKEGAADHYVMCWFDDTETDMTKDLRRLRGVPLTAKLLVSANEKLAKEPTMLLSRLNTPN